MCRRLPVRHRLAALLLLAMAGCSQPAPPPADVGVADARPDPGLANGAAPEPGVHTAGRIGAGDIAKLEAAGIRHVVDLTLDSETPAFDEAAAMREAGIAYDNLPIAGPDALTRENVQAFDALVAGADRPLLVHCASSNRVGAMAALRAAWIEGKPAEAAIAEGRAWGLRSLEGAVRERLAAEQ